MWVKNAPNAPWLTLPFALNTDLKSSWTNDSRADDRIYPGRIGNANLKYTSFPICETSKMNFANNRLTNLQIFYTNFSSFLSFMVGILQTLTGV